MCRKAESFMAANEHSPCVYHSKEGNKWVFRLQDNSKFTLTEGELEHVRIVWFGWGSMAPFRNRGHAAKAASPFMVANN